MTAPQSVPGQRSIEELWRWHALTEEPIIDASLPIVDAHHHLWNRPPQRYELDEFFADICTGHNIRASCFVECTAMYKLEGREHLRPIGETEYVNGMAAVSASGFYGDVRMCAAITSYADLRSEHLEETLHAHSMAGGGRFRGIRQQAQSDAVLGSMAKRPTPEGLLGDAAFRLGLGRLGAKGLVFDAVLYFTQLGELYDVARQCPETTIVVNHLGGPLGIGPYSADKQANFEQWRAGMAQLAVCPNVFVKIGGLGMTARGFGFELRPAPPTSEQLAQAWRPHVETAITLFGPERCMFESNFPVDAQSCGYAVLWNAFKRLTTGATDEERANLFSGVARKIYNIAG
jgi:L-fuconolactonase